MRIRVELVGVAQVVGTVLLLQAILGDMLALHTYVHLGFHSRRKVIRHQRICTS